MCMKGLSTHVCLCAPGAHDQERVSNPLGLELQMVVNHCVGTRNRTQVPWKNNLTTKSFLQPLILFAFMCIGVFPVCMHVHHVRIWWS